MTTKGRVRRSPSRNRLEKRPNAGDVGYGKPPRAHRFKPGQSGNPKGRPKGAQNTDTILRGILDRRIELRVGTSVRKISVREAILTRFAEDALKGNPKSAAFLLNRYDGSNGGETGNDVITQDDREIIDEFRQRILKSEPKDES